MTRHRRHALEQWAKTCQLQMHKIEPGGFKQVGQRSMHGNLVEHGHLQWHAAGQPPEHAQQFIHAPSPHPHDARAIRRKPFKCVRIERAPVAGEQGHFVSRTQPAQMFERTQLVPAHGVAGQTKGHEQDAHVPIVAGYALRLHATT